jgi:hypothetical protein
MADGVKMVSGGKSGSTSCNLGFSVFFEIPSFSPENGTPAITILTKPTSLGESLTSGE